MKRMAWAWITFVAGCAAPAGTSETPLRLFNGKDLTGFSTFVKSKGVNADPDGIFRVVDGVIHISGREYGYLITREEYEDYHLVLEFKWGTETHPPRKDLRRDSGILFHVTGPDQIWPKSIEFQIIEGGSGDLLLVGGTSVGSVQVRPRKNEPLTDLLQLKGTKVLSPDGKRVVQGWKRQPPSPEFEKPFGEWETLELIAQGGSFTYIVNGEVLVKATGAEPARGRILFQSEGAELFIRRIELRPLKASGVVSLFNGKDLSGWRTDPELRSQWRVEEGVLRCEGGKAPRKNLWTEKEYSDFELSLDWRFPGEPVEKEHRVILPDGTIETAADGKPRLVKGLDAGDSGIFLRGTGKSQVNLWCWPVGSGEVHGYLTDPVQPPEVRKGVTPAKKADRPLGLWNALTIRMQGDRLTVVLNGEEVISRARLPDVPARGSLGLQNHGDPVEFRNLRVKEIVP